jgi:5-(carboxyamino)imidazole ribonucleotide synthase
MKPFSFISTPNKLGILGGGQLGKMLLQCTRTWDVYTKVLDPDSQAPARLACDEFHVGGLKDFDTVYHFGKDCDVLTIEIEHVNVEALHALKAEGVKIHPDPEALEIIKDKGLQKMFFKAHDLPTSDFALFDNKAHILLAIEKGQVKLPFVQKSRTDGYDGRGVQVVNTHADLEQLIDAPCLVEELVQLREEIAVIAARNEQGEVVCYDPVAMEFVEGANMLDLLLYPYNPGKALHDEAQKIASRLIQEFNICGLLAVEFFIDRNGRLLINEVAPRPHNSGHQTIESSITSQYEQHLRAILNLPLGSTDVIIPSAMVNLLGAEGYSGQVHYENFNACLSKPGVHLHIYGKKQTKPYRKMGHVTVTHTSLDEAKKIALWVKQQLQVKSL